MYALTVVLSLTTFFISGFSETHETLLLKSPDIYKNEIVFEHGGDLWFTTVRESLARRLTTDKGYETRPKFSPDGKLIAFSGEYDNNNYDVYVMPKDGGSPVRLTYHPGADRVTGWTRDGEYILFISGRAGWRLPRLYKVSKNGGMPEEIPLPRVYAGSFSGDGRKFAYNRKTSRLNWKGYRGGLTPDIWVYDFDKDTCMKITKWEGTDVKPFWHEDKIYFLSDRDNRLNIYSFDLESGRIKQITNHKEFDVENFSIYGTKIVYEYGARLWIKDLMSGEPKPMRIRLPDDQRFVRKTYEEASTFINGFEVSPSGKRALFQAMGDIFTVPKENGPTRNISETPAIREVRPVWSPDGKWIAYLSDRTGEYEIYLRKSDGTGEEKEITHNGNCFRYKIVWSPDSKKLLYADSKLRLFYVDIKNKKPVLVDSSSVYRIHDYSWSPDSKWITCIKDNDNFYGSVWLYSLDKCEDYKVTVDLFDEDEVCFDPSGKYLYFISSRTFSPGGGDFSNLKTYPATQNICLLTLQKDTLSPFAPKSDEEKLEKEENEESEEAEKKEKPKETKIDLENIAKRIVTVPISAGDYRGLSAGENKIFYLRSEETALIQTGRAKKTLCMFDMEEREEHTIMKDIDDYSLSEDGEYILYKANSIFGIIEAKAKECNKGDGKVNLKEMIAPFVPELAWAEMFNDFWRLTRDLFYDPDMNGVNWTKLKQAYSNFLPHMAHRDELNYIIGGMQRELGTSHNYHGGGKTPKLEHVSIGLLGVDFEVDKKSHFYRFKKIYRGEAWQKSRISPLTLPGIDVQEGEYLIAIGDKIIHYPENIYKYFENTADKQIRITINSKPSIKDGRVIKIKPIDVDGEEELRYLDWVENNRKKVEKATNGRIGYIHVPNTAMWGLKEFGKYFFAQRDKEGLIIDVRYNGGGWSPMMFMDYLTQTPLSIFIPRYGEPHMDPFAKFKGNMVCLTNEYAGSGGDMFPYYFRELGLGKLIGATTWGGLLSCSGRKLMDGGVVVLPMYEVTNVENEKLLENEGVHPDIEIDNPPNLLMKGRDLQLEKAIEVLSK